MKIVLPLTGVILRERDRNRRTCAEYFGDCPDRSKKEVFAHAWRRSLGFMQIVLQLFLEVLQNILLEALVATLGSGHVLHEFTNLDFGPLR